MGMVFGGGLIAGKVEAMLEKNRCLKGDPLKKEISLLPRGEKGMTSRWGKDREISD